MAKRKMTEQQKAALAKHAFKPGQSGNPKGFSKAHAEVARLARKHTEESITTLVTIMRDPDQPGSVRVKACEVLLDRGHGKAPQTIRVNTLEEMSDAELEAFIAEKEALLAAIGDDDTVH